MQNSTKIKLLRLCGFISALGSFVIPAIAWPPAFFPLVLISLSCILLAERINPEPPLPYICPYSVEFDDEEVRVIFKGKLHEKVKWSEVGAVGIRIDESYPPAPWWILFGGPKAGCMYPSEAKGGQEMLEEMQKRLPNFDNMAVIEAMGLMKGGRMVWSKTEQT